MPTRMLKLAPTLLVDEIEPVLRFWTEVLGFAKTAEVPGADGKLVFAMLTEGAVEVHLQSRASAAGELDYLVASRPPPSSFLYIDVADVKALHDQIRDRVEILVPLSRTFYGATHFFIKDPGGHVIGFSQNG